MAEKVKRKVPQSVADAMQELEGWMGTDKERSEKVLIVAEMLADGYEVEPSKNDILLKRYEFWRDTFNEDRAAELKNTLDTLNIKIKGINE